MEEIFQSQFTWWDFFIRAILLIALYFLLQFFERTLERFQFLDKYQPTVLKFVHYALLIYEAAVLLILGGVFILIRPVYHGILALIVVAGGFVHIKNYFSGRVVQFDDTFGVGQQIKTEETQGLIRHMDRLGVKIKTNKGLQRVSYSKLLKNGYTLLSGNEIGGFYRLEIQPNQEEEKKDYVIQLLDLLNTTPYLDWNHYPQVFPIKGKPNTLKAKVLVKEESHLYDLIALIEEWGFTCKVV